MSYIALARKWRPRLFSQLVGQDLTTKALINSLNQHRLHHAYLFTGTRGVGKTSVARLLAKALNCEKGISSEPCLQCETCLAIEQGRFIDLIEVDGASRTRVEDTREILDNVHYAPTQGRFKIYLIDEVHMLSQHSFNALLKTLEEPPAHVKFLLATTDPQKLPLTVLSRCLHFNLKHLSLEAIASHLQRILDEEKLSYELPAVNLLAKAARGSMRDALSLLDQAIATCTGDLQTHDIQAILGFTQQDYALQLLHALAANEASKMLAISRHIGSEGGHFRYVLDEIIAYLHQITVTQSLSQANLLIEPMLEIKELSKQLTPEDSQLFYQISLKGIEELSLAPTMAIGFEMILLRMLTFKPAPAHAMPRLMHAITPSEPTSEAATHLVMEQQPAQLLAPELAKTLIIPTSPVVLTEQTNEPEWHTILPQLKLSGLALSAAENAEIMSKVGQRLVLRVATGHLSLFTSSVITRIEQALANYYSEKITITLNSETQVNATPALQKKISQEKQHQEAEASLRCDPFFNQLQTDFSAELVKNSIASVKDSL